MKQQINLYQPIFRKQRIIFSARTILWLSVGFIAVLLLWSVLVDQRVSRLEDEYHRQLEAEQRAVGQLTELRQNMPPSEPNPELEQHVEQLEQQRNNLDETLAALGQRLPAAEVELGSRLDALARRTPDGLWWTGLELGDNGQHLILRGRALSPQLVPSFLDSLSEEPLLNGIGFRTVRVSASEDHIPGVDFMLSTDAEVEP